MCVCVCVGPRAQRNLKGEDTFIIVRARGTLNEVHIPRSTFMAIRSLIADFKYCAHEVEKKGI